MWLLLFIFITNSQFDRIEIAGVYYSHDECTSKGDYGASIGIPEGLTLSCIKLNGVTEANGYKKLHERIRRLPQ